MKRVAAILKGTSASGVSGPPVQIRKSTRLAQATRQKRNVRRTIFSIILVITPFAIAWFQLDYLYIPL